MAHQQQHAHGENHTSLQDELYYGLEDYIMDQAVTVGVYVYEAHEAHVCYTI
jgi:hypothetical protein